ncbi:MAG: FimB/Mfa2 family fimbrial subunit [Candidatus Symbiothrix sp.]|nr:FimB/Mfa2 family fimbrial subunit [Candidatus Symbiothrix sp.]
MRYRALLLVLVIAFSGCIYDNDLSDCPQGIIVDFYSKTPCNVDTLYPEFSNVTIALYDANGNFVPSRAKNDTINAKNGTFTVKATATDGEHRYAGESEPVFLPDPQDAGTVFKYAPINMKEITSRVTIVVTGLPNANNYEVTIESPDATLDGNVSKIGELDVEFTVLNLATNFKGDVVIKTKQDGTELYRGDLLNALLLQNPTVNLECDHDFDIRFTVDDHGQTGTYAIAQIWVNNWLVHSYGTDL